MRSMGMVKKLLTLPLVLGVLLALGSPALAVGVYSSPLDPGEELAHPMLSVFQVPTFTIFSYSGQTREEALGAAGFSLADAMSSEFAGAGTSGLSGTLNAEVWRYDGASGEGDGHLLFLYQLLNTSDCLPSSVYCDIRTVSILGGHWAAHAITDTGLIRSGPGNLFQPGDLLSIERPGPDAQLGQYYGLKMGDYIEPGDLSAWFYFETDALQFGYGEAHVAAVGDSAVNIPTFAPAPEPVTMIALLSGVIGLGGYIKKRRAGLAR